MFKFKSSNMVELEELIHLYKESLASPYESFLEDHILESVFFKICLEEKIIGYCAIYKNNLITQFFVLTEYRKYSQSIYREVRKLQTVQYAFVPTCDEFFLSHALDDVKLIEKQAYFFEDVKGMIHNPKPISLTVAIKADIPKILELSQDFFYDLEKHIEKNHIFIVRNKDIIVGFGIIEEGRLLTDYISTGMFICPEYREQGYGKSVIIKLKEIVYQMNKTPIAGCWYYNHNSKKSLEAAGYYSQTRLLKIHY